MKYFLITLFTLMVVAQWAVPVSMIRIQEATITNGKVFKFKTRPVDPTDPFRGKYVTLSFEAESFLVDSSEHWERYSDVFVLLEEDSLGFAKIAGVSKDKPGTTSDFVKARISYQSVTNHLHISYPFDRFYLEESKAPEAERIYRDSQSDSSRVTYAVVSIRNGEAALQDVQINGKSVVEIVRELNAAHQ